MGTEVVYKPIQKVSKDIETPFPEIKVAFAKTYISKRATQSGGGAGATLYSVPAGKLFVCLTADCSQAATNASAGGIFEIMTNDPNIASLISCMTINPLVGQILSSSQSLSFGLGIKFPAGTTFTFFRGSNQDVAGGISGYLVDANAESLFYLT